MLKIDVRSEHDMEQAITLINLRSEKLKTMEITIFVSTLAFANIFMENLHKDIEEVGKEGKRLPLLLHFVLTSPQDDETLNKLQQMQEETNDLSDDIFDE